jgi:aldehyde:ferredoxin oxidoreductase
VKCCTGIVLEVNLSTGDIKKRKVPEIVYENVLSGKGLGAWYLNKYIPAGADPLGPDNIIGFMTGALAGTGALISGRWTIVTKSPLTGGWGDANCGGMFSPAIKQCGFDGIFFRGISPQPVYLYVDNKTMELRDAANYWGMDVKNAEEQLVNDNWDKKRPAVALIGKAGEKRSLISGICNEGGRIAARSGVGAVMGSKRLKAVVLAGSKPMPCANRDAVNEISHELGMKLKKSGIPGFIKGGMLGLGGTLLGKMPTTMAMDGMMSAPLLKKWGTSMNTPMAINSGDGPIKNWGGTPKDAKGAIKAFDPDRVISMETQKYHCYSCGLGCGGILNISKVSKSEFSESHKAEYETLEAFGALLLNDDLSSVLVINEMLNLAGMDSISAGGTVAYAIEAYQNGIITKEQTGGLELTWGNATAIVKLVKMIIEREGIGDILADGSKKASSILGGSEYAINIGGEEPGMHDSRNDPQLAVHYMAEPAPGKHTIGMGMMYGTLAVSEICSWAPPAIMTKKSDELIPSRETAYKTVANACYSMLTDGVGGCYYAEMLGTHAWNPVKYMNAAAGLEKSGDEYMEMGKRIQTLRQLFNIKHGVDPRSFKLPKRMQGIPPLTNGPLKGKTVPVEEMVKYHWEVFGWNRETGIPLDSTLDSLGIPQLLELEVE